MRCHISLSPHLGLGTHAAPLLGRGPPFPVHTLQYSHSTAALKRDSQGWQERGKDAAGLSSRPQSLPDRMMLRQMSQHTQGWREGGGHAGGSGPGSPGDGVPGPAPTSPQLSPEEQFKRRLLSLQQEIQHARTRRDVMRVVDKERRLRYGSHYKHRDVKLFLLRRERTPSLRKKRGGLAANDSLPRPITIFKLRRRFRDQILQERCVALKELLPPLELRLGQHLYRNIPGLLCLVTSQVVTRIKGLALLLKCSYEEVVQVVATNHQLGLMEPRQVEARAAKIVRQLGLPQRQVIDALAACPDLLALGAPKLIQRCRVLAELLTLPLPSAFALLEACPPLSQLPPERLAGAVHQLQHLLLLIHSANDLSAAAYDSSTAEDESSATAATTTAAACDPSTNVVVSSAVPEEQALVRAKQLLALHPTFMLAIACAPSPAARSVGGAAGGGGGAGEDAGGDGDGGGGAASVIGESGAAGVRSLTQPSRASSAGSAAGAGGARSAAMQTSVEHLPLNPASALHLRCQLLCQLLDLQLAEALQLLVDEPGLLALAGRKLISAAHSLRHIMDSLLSMSPADKTLASATTTSAIPTTPATTSTSTSTSTTTSTSSATATYTSMYTSTYTSTCTTLSGTQDEDSAYADSMAAQGTQDGDSARASASTDSMAVQGPLETGQFIVTACSAAILACPSLLLQPPSTTRSSVIGLLKLQGRLRAVKEEGAQPQRQSHGQVADSALRPTPGEEVKAQSPLHGHGQVADSAPRPRPGEEVKAHSPLHGHGHAADSVPRPRPGEEEEAAEGAVLVSMILKDPRVLLKEGVSKRGGSSRESGIRASRGSSSRGSSSCTSSTSEGSSSSSSRGSTSSNIGGIRDASSASSTMGGSTNRGRRSTMRDSIGRLSIRGEAAMSSQHSSLPSGLQARSRAHLHVDLESRFHALHNALWALPAPEPEPLHSTSDSASPSPSAPSSSLSSPSPPPSMSQSPSTHPPSSSSSSPPSPCTSLFRTWALVERLPSLLFINHVGAAKQQVLQVLGYQHTGAGGEEHIHDVILAYPQLLLAAESATGWPHGQPGVVASSHAQPSWSSHRALLPPAPGMGPNHHGHRAGNDLTLGFDAVLEALQGPCTEGRRIATGRRACASKRGASSEAMAAVRLNQLDNSLLALAATGSVDEVQATAPFLATRTWLLSRKVTSEAVQQAVQKAARELVAACPSLLVSKTDQANLSRLAESLLRLPGASRTEVAVLLATYPHVLLPGCYQRQLSVEMYYRPSRRERQLSILQRGFHWLPDLRQFKEGADFCTSPAEDKQYPCVQYAAQLSAACGFGTLPALALICSVLTKQHHRPRYNSRGRILTQDSDENGAGTWNRMDPAMGYADQRERSPGTGRTALPVQAAQRSGTSGSAHLAEGQIHAAASMVSILRDVEPWRTELDRCLAAMSPSNTQGLEVLLLEWQHGAQRLQALVANNRQYSISFRSALSMSPEADAQLSRGPEATARGGLRLMKGIQDVSGKKARGYMRRSSQPSTPTIHIQLTDAAKEAPGLPSLGGASGREMDVSNRSQTQQAQLTQPTQPTQLTARRPWHGGRVFGELSSSPSPSQTAGGLHAAAGLRADHTTGKHLHGEPKPGSGGEATRSTGKYMQGGQEVRSGGEAAWSSRDGGKVGSRSARPLHKQHRRARPKRSMSDW